MLEKIGSRKNADEKDREERMHRKMKEEPKIK